MTFFLLDTLSFPAVLELLTSMRAELVLSCFYSPIGVSPENLIIFRNYTYSGIASTKNSKISWLGRYSGWKKRFAAVDRYFYPVRKKALPR